MFHRMFVGCLSLATLAIVAGPAKAICADVALVLAVDSSGSINPEQFSLQKQGYVAAFRDERVQAALEGAGVVDVAVVFWGDTELAPQIIPWQRIESPADADFMAGLIASVPRKVTGNTGIGRGIWTSLDLLAASETCAARQLINVSGDGYESISPRAAHHVPLAKARERAQEMGVVINGLAITHEVADLESWYRDRVITGPGAFVMSVTGFTDFADAIARKLEREIAEPLLAWLPVSAGRVP